MSAIYKAFAEPHEINLTEDEVKGHAYPYSEYTRKYLLKRRYVMLAGLLIFGALLITEIVFFAEMIQDNPLRDIITENSVTNYNIYLGISVGLRFVSLMCLLFSILHYKNYQISSLLVFSSLFVDLFLTPFQLFVPIEKIITFQQLDTVNSAVLTVRFIYRSIIDNTSIFLLLQSSIIQLAQLHRDFYVNTSLSETGEETGEKSIFRAFLILLNIIYTPLIILICAIAFHFTEHYTFIPLCFVIITYLHTIADKKTIYMQVFRFIMVVGMLYCVIDVIYYLEVDFWHALVRFLLRMLYINIFVKDILLSSLSRYLPMQNVGYEFSYDWHKNFETPVKMKTIPPSMEGEEKKSPLMPSETIVPTPMPSMEGSEEIQLVVLPSAPSEYLEPHI